ncbi:hypothetical protein, partial [Alcanivorax profundi]|uniref:hypothetical protein n=1 Tax=Alcanivorax profundi TaxID=2338368 RepID=UPI001F4678CC
KTKEDFFHFEAVWIPEIAPEPFHRRFSISIVNLLKSRDGNKTLVTLSFCVRMGRFRIRWKGESVPLEIPLGTVAFRHRLGLQK